MAPLPAQLVLAARGGGGAGPRAVALLGQHLVRQRVEHQAGRGRRRAARGLGVPARRVPAPAAAGPHAGHREVVRVFITRWRGRGTLHMVRVGKTGHRGRVQEVLGAFSTEAERPEQVLVRARRVGRAHGAISREVAAH